MSHSLEIDEDDQGQAQRYQTEYVANDVDEGRQLDAGREFVYWIGRRQMHAFLIIGIAVPCSIVVAISGGVFYNCKQLKQHREA